MQRQAGYPNLLRAVTLLAETKMRPFTRYDWYGFAGCETANPTIGENGKFCIVLDGTNLTLVLEGDAGGGELYDLA